MVLRMMYYELNNGILTILTKGDEIDVDIKYLNMFVSRHESQIKSIEIFGKIKPSKILLDYIRLLGIDWMVTTW